MQRAMKGLPYVMHGKVTNKIFAYVFIIIFNLIPGTSRSEVDCSALDPRVSITKEREGQVSASVETLYKVAKAGGNVQGRIKEEIKNLQEGAATSEKMQIKLRALYLFCGMIANSPEIPIDRKFSLLNFIINDQQGTQIPKAAVATEAQVNPKPKTPKSTSGAPKHVTVLFQETFNKPGWLPESQFPNSGRTLYREGWYVLQNTTANLAFFYRLNEAGFFPSAARIEVDVRLNAGPLEKPFGLLLGCTDVQFANCHSVLIRGDGATEIIRWNDNKDYMELYLPHREHIKIGYGATNSIAIEINDLVLTYFVNGTQVGKYKAANPIQGYIGFYTDYPGMDVGFRNLKVSQ